MKVPLVNGSSCQKGETRRYRGKLYAFRCEQYG